MRSYGCPYICLSVCVHKRRVCMMGDWMRITTPFSSQIYVPRLRWTYSILVRNPPPPSHHPVQRYRFDPSILPPFIYLFFFFSLLKVGDGLWLGDNFPRIKPGTRLPCYVLWIGVGNWISEDFSFREIDTHFRNYRRITSTWSWSGVLCKLRTIL